MKPVAAATNQVNQPTSRRNAWVWATRRVSVFGSPVHSSNAVWVISGCLPCRSWPDPTCPAPGWRPGSSGSGVDGDSVVVQFGRKALGQPVESGLHRAVDTEAGRTMNSENGGPPGRSPPTDVTLSTQPRPRSRMTDRQLRQVQRCQHVHFTISRTRRSGNSSSGRRKGPRRCSP